MNPDSRSASLKQLLSCSHSVALIYAFVFVHVELAEDCAIVRK